MNSSQPLHSVAHPLFSTWAFPSPLTKTKKSTRLSFVFRINRERGDACVHKTNGIMRTRATNDRRIISVRNGKRWLIEQTALLWVHPQLVGHVLTCVLSPPLFIARVKDYVNQNSTDRGRFVSSLSAQHAAPCCVQTHPSSPPCNVCVCHDVKWTCAVFEPSDC